MRWLGRVRYRSSYYENLPLRRLALTEDFGRTAQCFPDVDRILPWKARTTLKDEPALFGQDDDIMISNEPVSSFNSGERLQNRLMQCNATGATDGSHEKVHLPGIGTPTVT